MTKALLSGDPSDQLAIAYHLLVDNKMMAESKYFVCHHCQSINLSVYQYIYQCIDPWIK